MSRSPRAKIVDASLRFGANSEFTKADGASSAVGSGRPPWTHRAGQHLRRASVCPRSSPRYRRPREWAPARTGRALRQARNTATRATDSGRSGRQPDTGSRYRGPRPFRPTVRYVHLGGWDVVAARLLSTGAVRLYRDAAGLSRGGERRPLAEAACWAGRGPWPECRTWVGGSAAAMGVGRESAPRGGELSQSTEEPRHE